MRSHVNARGDWLPAVSRPITDGLRCGDGTGCDDKSLGVRCVHGWHRLPDTMKTGRPCFLFPGRDIFLEFPIKKILPSTRRIQALVALLCAKSPSGGDGRYRLISKSNFPFQKKKIRIKPEKNEFSPTIPIG